VRYRGIVAVYQQLAWELVIFGCHVHVGLDDTEGAIQVLNRSRVWLAPLLALSANSPFWMGEDSGYDSFRTELWGRWPMAGQPHLFESREEHDTLVQALIDTGAIQDASRIYWDIRIPKHVPTVEFRVTDVCLTIDEAVMVAGLVRGIARTCCEAAQRNEPFPAARPELLRAAHWRAARYGLSGELIDVEACRSVPAEEVIESMLRFARPGMEASGDWEEVSALVVETLARGNGATRQREVFQRTGRLEDVVDFIVQETVCGTGADVAS
jgi:glutamate---cysteine ligase / carboxylate-amine ligase